MAGRVFVIGIDGGDFSLIKRWANEGKLPHFKNIMNQGSYGKLRSTIPPITGAAWSSFQTGTNPGKHGAFNWFKRVEGEYRAAPVNRNDISEPTLWQILSKQDKKVGIIGVPVTYPPQKINGFMIPGLLTPNKSSRQSYPRDLIDEVREIAPDFKFSPKEWTRGYEPRGWVDEMKDDIDNKVKVTLDFMDKKDWDMMMVHFMETDQVQHFMWDHIDKNEGDWDPVLDIYRRADQALGKIEDKLDEEDTLLIMSDHGFGPLRYDFHIDTWLLKEGYIKFKNNPMTLLKRLGFNMGITKESLYPVGEYLYPFLTEIDFLNSFYDIASNPILEWLFLSSQNVNWEKTQAYSHSEIGHIYLNVKGREPQGCVDPEDVSSLRDEIIGKLKELKNPFTGKKITSQIYKGEELYHGKKSKYAPDIVFLPDDMEIIGKGAYDFLCHKTISPSRYMSGHHRMDGIFMARGPEIKAENEMKAHIMDIAPTILYHMGLPQLESMDGEIIESIYSEEFLELNEEEKVTKEDLDLDLNSDDDDLDDEEMKKRLKGLGYVS